MWNFHPGDAWRLRGVNGAVTRDEQCIWERATVMRGKLAFLNLAGLFSAGASSFCCLGPVALAGFGASSVGLSMAATLAPYGRWFTVLALSLLGVSYYFTWLRSRRKLLTHRDLVTVAISTLLVILTVLFPSYRPWLGV